VYKDLRIRSSDKWLRMRVRPLQDWYCLGRKRESWAACSKNVVVFKKHHFLVAPALRLSRAASSLAAEAVKGAALALEGVDHVEGGHCLAAGVLGVGHGITDHVLQEDLENTAGLLVYKALDSQEKRMLNNKGMGMDTATTT
jgi:hypothetical protein